MEKKNIIALGKIAKLDSEVSSGQASGVDIDRLFESPLAGIAVIAKKMERSDDETRYRAFVELVDELDSSDMEKLTAEEQGDFWLAYHDGWKSITVAQAAEKLGVSEQQVLNLIGGGKVKARKVDGRWKVSDTSVDFRIERLKKA